MSRTGEAVVLIGMALLLQTPAHAQDVATSAPTHSAGMVWHCWYGNGPEQATCFRPAPGVQPSDPANAVDDAIRTMTSELIRNGNFIAATRVFRRFPGAFTGITRVIPLHTIPVDLEAVAWLAQSVMCARVREPCAVAFDMRWTADETRPLPLGVNRGRRFVPY